MAIYAVIALSNIFEKYKNARHSKLLNTWNHGNVYMRQRTEYRLFMVKIVHNLPFPMSVRYLECKQKLAQ